MEYLSWNNLLAEYFFKPDAAGKRVHLSVTSSLIAELGQMTNSDLADFVSAIKVGAPWVTRQGICQKALQAMTGWRQRELPYPPYIGYLGAFVLAADWGDDFAPHAYYPRLRDFLDESAAVGQYPSFDRMLELWDDLERWANEDMRGELGDFRADIVGGWINVGLPVAQVILTEQERQRLHLIFAESGLDPSSLPSDKRMAELLVARGQHRLRPRTLQVLQTPIGNEEIRYLLISTALEELREWDGQYTIGEDQTPQIYGALRLCARVDRVAQRIQLSLRCRSRHEIPEEGLILTLDGQNGEFECLDYVLGWSTELTLSATGSLFDPSKIDWTLGASGVAADLGWRFRFAPSDVKLFENGSATSIPGIVEIPRLLKQRPFYIASHGTTVDLIAHWGAVQCQSFVDLSIGYGLPAGWKLFYSAGANSDELVREHFPSLAFNSTVRVYFEGGIRSSRNQYFSFELPRLVVEGDNPTLDVYCETARLTPDTDGRYSIPNDIIRPGRLSLEVKHQDVVLAKRNIFVDDNVPVSQSSSFSGNRFAQMFQSQPGDASICGAIALGQAPPYNVVFLPEAKGEPRVIFIGRIPGQIAFLGADERPQAWAPVWAIVMHRRGKAIFCGSDIHDASPIENESNDKRSVQEWKRILWHRRKRIAPPSHEGLQRLWSSYQERAKTL